MRPFSSAGRVLVTGAAGFIASHLIEHLLIEGRPVVGIDNFDSFYPRVLKEANVAHLRAVALSSGTPFAFEEGDFTAPAALAALPDGIEAIVHLGGKAGVRPSIADAASYTHTNVVGTHVVLEWARARGIENFVFGSSSSVYGDDSALPFNERASADRPLSPYAATKRSAEILAATYTPTCLASRWRACACSPFTGHGSGRISPSASSPPASPKADPSSCSGAATAAAITPASPTS